jgi:hypothetical protein
MYSAALGAMVPGHLHSTRATRPNTPTPFPGPMPPLHRHTRVGHDKIRAPPTTLTYFIQRQFVFKMLKTTATKKVWQVAPLFNPLMPIVLNREHRVLPDFVKQCGH